MDEHFLNLHGFIAPFVSNWLQFALATPVVLWASWPFFVRVWLFVLIAMGTGVACIYSVVATLAPQIFAATFRVRRCGRGLF
jgi:P-type Cu+ transporter